ncbi:uncharacterized protein ACR2FA_011832 [Aphomia sociella]
MALKILPECVQSVLSSSSYISTYKRAIEELVYNAIDAHSTSIAVRIHIEQSKIQVIDNGHGITEHDFVLLGQRHTTSKCTDLKTLKAASNTYGYRGHSLADIVSISQNVKITSRSENNDDTWIKIFHKSKVTELKKTSVRPSKGTTVEIKGFLYNLHIQSKAVRSLNEINKIKLFMQHVSLIHCSISLSLRDDSKNEIIFKAHKNRDICQTIQLLFNIDTQDIQEFKVEKNEYKVTAYFGKKYRDLGQTQWIYLNGKFLSNSRLHKLINNQLKKSFQTSKNIKSKNNVNEEPDIIKCKLPFYIILLSCPYYDYHISNTPKHTILEFKNWDEITKLLNKLIKFYIGDEILKKQLKPQNKIVKRKVDDTRDQVRKIVERLLKKNPKNMGVSQMQNGVKGKLIKRKIKKKALNISLSKVIPPKRISAITPFKKLENLEYPNEFHEGMNAVNEVAKNKTLNITKKKQYKTSIKTPEKTSSNKIYLNCNKSDIAPINEPINSDKLLPITCSKKVKKKEKNKRRNKKIKCINKQLLNNLNTYDIPKMTIQPSADSVEKNGTFLNINVISKETENKNSSVWKKIEEFISYEFLPHPLKSTQPSYKDENLNKIKQNFTSSHNLLNTILNTQVHNYLPSLEANRSFKESSKLWNFKVGADIKPSSHKSNDIINSELTYNSHKYNKNDILHNMFNLKKKSRFQFITTNSKDNFINIRNKNGLLKFKQHVFKSIKNKHKGLNVVFGMREKIKNKELLQESACTIEFSKTCNDVLCPEFYPITEANISSSICNLSRKSKTIDIFDCDKETFSKLYNENKDNTISLNNVGTYPNYCNEIVNNTIDITQRNSTDGNNYNKNTLRAVNSQNIISASNTDNLLSNEHIEPLNVCEAIIHSKSDSVLEKEVELSFKQNKLNNDFFNVASKENTSNVSRNNEIKESNDNVIQKEDELNFRHKKLNDSLFNIESIDDTLNDTHINEMKGSNISHHFNALAYNADRNKNIASSNVCHNTTQDPPLYENMNQEYNNLNIENICNDLVKDINDFDLKTRLNFVPKGLSPIFQNCFLNNTCNYNFEQDYFEDDVYHNFINNVHINSEIFKPKIQHISEINTKYIDKINTRLQKESSSLTFDAASLQYAKVLNQVDSKYIAATMKVNSTDYLVLFDQHAVHERIRLEANMSDYFNGHEWTSVRLDEIILNLSEDELLYVHNYKDKFTRFGLAYTILNKCEIAINAIPKAILGKNTRQVEKVIAAVKNLIREEINVIKSQGGCISIYPKAIMDLVFSEACRYAVKFGDKLTRDDCTDFLKSLSECKTPFQCAHGRPVMAVMTNIKYRTNCYQANLTQLKAFKSNLMDNFKRL